MSRAVIQNSTAALCKISQHFEKKKNFGRKKFWLSFPTGTCRTVDVDGHDLLVRFAVTFFTAAATAVAAPLRRRD
jgi:hypothetical protein